MRVQSHRTALFNNFQERRHMRRKRRTDLRDYSIAERPQNSRDCVVRTLHIASGMPYDMCYLAIALCGRRNNCGARLSAWVKAFQKLGLCKPEHLVNRRHEQVPADNVIVLIYGHVFAIKNGVHSDGQYAHLNNKSRVKLAWRIP